MNRWLHRMRWGVPAVGILFLSPISASSEPAAAPNATGAQPASADRAIASWKGGQLTTADFEAVLALKLPQERITIAAPGGRERLLEELIRFDLLVQEASARGYATRPAVIDAAQQAAIDAMYARDFLVTPESITQAELDEYWKEHGPGLQRPRARRGALIVVATEAEANALRRELAGADRAKFAKAAVERSLDKRTGHQGGELGYFDIEGTPRPQPVGPHVPKTVVDAVFALRKEGDISKKPFPVEGGYGIAMFTGETPAVVRKLEDEPWHSEIRATIAGKRMQKMKDELVAKLFEQYKPEVKAELVDAIVLEPPRKSDIPEGSPAAPRDPREPLKTVEPDNY